MDILRRYTREVAILSFLIALSVGIVVAEYNEINASNNATSNAGANLINETKNITPVIAQNITGNITPITTQNVTEGITQNATGNITLANIPQISITQPKKGSSVRAGNVKIAVAVKNFTIVNKQGQANAAGEGHLNYFMDVMVPTTSGEPSVMANGTYVQETNKSYTWKNVRPGKHNFSVELVNNDNTPLSPAVVKEVNITVTSAVNKTVNKTSAVTANKTSAAAVNKTVSQNKTSAAARNVTGNVAQSKISSKAVIVNVAAKSLAFNTSTITVPAGAKVTINFDNQDSGIYHNIAIYTDASAKESIYVGMPVVGRSLIAYAFNAPSTPGTYFFQDNKNPTTMKGQFIVE